MAGASRISRLLIGFARFCVGMTVYDWILTVYTKFGQLCSNLIAID